MRALFFFPRVIFFALLALALLPVPGAHAQSTYLAFTVTIDGFSGGPRVTIVNNSRGIQIDTVTMSIGDLGKNFDGVFAGTAPLNGTMTLVGTDTENGGAETDLVTVNLTGFDPGENFTFDTDLDLDGSGNDSSFADYRTTFFNSPSGQNSVVTVRGGGLTASITLPNGANNLNSYTFSLPRPSRTLKVESLTEAALAVRAVTIKINGVTYLDPRFNAPSNSLVGQMVTVPVSDGDSIEIRGPQEVYKNIFGVDITDSIANNPSDIENAEERFTAIGISVNNQAQTGDPTLYRFDISENTTISVKWRHDYALTIDHDFTLTESQDDDALGQPWAGPLTSKAVGNPIPEAKKHWVAKGSTMTAFIDGQVLDFNRPGLDVRYVPVAYVAYGPPTRRPPELDVIARNSGIDIRHDPANQTTVSFAVGQAPLSRQQVPQSSGAGENSFVMSGPGGVTYVWHIQYGVRVNADDPARTTLPKIFQRVGPTVGEAYMGEGTFWFEPGVDLIVACQTNSADGMALAGWLNGDGHYFSSSGDVDSNDGSLVQGGPEQGAALWTPLLYDSQGKGFRGMEIPQLNRGARVLWKYGGQQIKTHANIGEFVFQGSPNASIFTQQPDLIQRVAVTGQNQNAADSEMAIWDPVAGRLYPLVPGIFKASWRPVNGNGNSLDVIVTVSYPDIPHYPHIADAPPVALDPDPTDNFVFQGLKYTENQAVVDDNKLFTASLPGKSVLLFSEIQRVGRGQPREFLRVRVVDTRRWDQTLPTDGTAIIGRKITDPGLDRANLGTGFLMFNGARYNPFVYDVNKLTALAAKDVYDMTLLRSNAVKSVTHRENLPGPIIPVNLFPGAANTQRLVVVWYDDPTLHDELLWPHRARIYNPRWPTTEAEGLGRIVIASQFGSESIGTNGLDQVVVEGTTNVLVGGNGTVITNVLPTETTYNPSRLQQARIYNQPDKNLPGYNPNEEHALMAPSFRFVTVSPRPLAAYALRNNDLNKFNRSNVTLDERLENAATFTSHPFVLVQFFDTEENEFRMHVYKVQKEDPAVPNYSFANGNNLLRATDPRVLVREPHVTMEAGEPVIPFYPLVQVIGATPCEASFGYNFKGQLTYWEDHKGSSWAVSGGENAWFTASFHYPLQPDFWWPPNQPGFVREVLQSGFPIQTAEVPQAGDCVSFVPKNIDTLLGFPPHGTIPYTGNVDADITPTRILYKSDWPLIAPVLKAGETLTFSGGEHRADNQFSEIVDENGDVEVVETPGLPGVLAFASAEVVFDTLNGDGTDWRNKWTARIAQVLDRRYTTLKFSDFPPELQPATKRTRLKQGKFVFTELPASLQKRIRYDATAGKLEMVGLLNDKEIGNHTLSAAPPAVYILEPNIMTATEFQKLQGLSENINWRRATFELYKLSRNPSLIDSDNSAIPSPSAADYRSKLETFWRNYYTTVGALSPGQPVPLPVPILDADDGYLVGLEPKVLRDSTDRPVTIEDPVVPGLRRSIPDVRIAAPVRSFGPGLALVPNPGFLNQAGNYPDISWVTVVENNDPTLGGAPITLHVIQVKRDERYRGAIKTSVSDNVFDENLGLRHTGDFGANADELYFEWWYRPDDGSLNVPPPDLLRPGDPNPWKLFPDTTGNQGRNMYQITLKGNPNAPEALLADTFWFVRYRHLNDVIAGTNWKVPQPDGSSHVNFTWAGAGNSDPFHDFDLDGIADYRAQLAEGWIKRVLDRVNPYESRVNNFEGDNPSTVASMIQEFGARFEGPVALNPDKNVIENVGLIELYETILKRGKDLSIDLSQPVSTPAIANALQLAATRISDFYTILGHEAYSDAQDPTIGFGSDSVEYGSLAPTVFSFQNQLPSLIDEELALLRGVDDYFARPVYNRLFWNFTKGEGEAAYALNYNISDINQDGFVDENDAMILYPQGHGDAWGHYLTAMRNRYELLKHENFNWVSRAEFYNLQDIVIKVDFLDERKFAQTAAAKAKTGAEIVNLTYRQKYVEDGKAQWQGYTDSNQDRAWGVQEWARRSAQGAYFDWVTANALLPSTHPNTTLDGVQKVDRQENSDISVVSAAMNSIQMTFDQANKGQNPLGLAGDIVSFDLDPARLASKVTHFDQIYERAIKALDNAVQIWDNANLFRNSLRKIGNSEMEFRNKVFQEDLAFKNKLIAAFGRPYEGTIGPGKIYPAGYDGADLLLFMYVDVRTVDNTTVPGPTADFATFTGNTLTGGEIYEAFANGQGKGGAPRAPLADIQHPFLATYLDDDVRKLFAPSLSADKNGVTNISVRNGIYNVNYTDLQRPRVPLPNLAQILPIMPAGYTFQAPRDWGSRVAIGDLQLQINKMLQQEVALARAIAEWDAAQGNIIRTLRITNAKLDVAATLRLKNEIFSRLKLAINDTIKGIETIRAIKKTLGDTTKVVISGTKSGIPTSLPIVGLAVGPGDALSAVRAGLTIAEETKTVVLNVTDHGLDIAKFVALATLDATENELSLFEKREQDALAAKELLKSLEQAFYDEPIKRLAIFKELQAMRELSDKYRASVDTAIHLIDERAAYNKRVAAQTQRSRYQDMTFRVSRNAALQNYHSAFDLAARYTYMAAKAYDYETNFDPNDPGSPQSLYSDIIKARALGNLTGGEARLGKGGLAEVLARLKINYDAMRGQLGINNPQLESGKISLRSELFRILPKGTNVATEESWRQALQNSRVDDLWMLPEYRALCRPLAAEADGAGNHVKQPALVIRFSTEINAGRNFFGKPLGGADHAFDPSSYSTKVRGAGIWFSDYASSNLATQLPVTPRVYLIPAGEEVMRVSRTPDPNLVRVWHVVDEQIPVPLPSITADLDSVNFSPLKDTLDGRLGDPRQFSTFRAYPDASAIIGEELNYDTRLVGRSVWNTQWVLVIPGILLNADPEEGLRRFIGTVTDIKMVFQTYGYSGN